MKKLTLILLSLSILFFSAGCGAKTPKDVAVKWYQALLDNDLETANKYSTQRIWELNRQIATSPIYEDSEQYPVRYQFGDVPWFLWPNGMKTREGLTILKDTYEEINGDSARLFIGKQEALKLKKIDGEWKVEFGK